MAYTYRKVDWTEWHRVAQTFTQFTDDTIPDPKLPHPALAEIVVAEDEDGNIVGFLVAQLVKHLEPLWIAPDHRGKVSWTKLVNMLDPHGCYMFAHDGKSARRAEVFGARKEKYNAVYYKD